MQPIHDLAKATIDYPDIKLSYETVSHKKVSVNEVPVNENKITGNKITAVAIPPGKKHILWTTAIPQSTVGVAYLIELGKNHQNNTVMLRGYSIPLHAPIPLKYKYGVILHGTLIQSTDTAGSGSGTQTQTFIVDDLYMFEGHEMDSVPWGYRVPFLVNVMRDFPTFFADDFAMALAVMWNPAADIPIGNSDSDMIAGYPVRHIQYRENKRMTPYVNVLTKKPGQTDAHPPNGTRTEDTSESTRHVLAKMMPPPMVPRFVYQNNQFRLNTVFLVSADVQYDVYNLFALGKAGAKVFVGLAGIQNYKTSVFMNRIFRKIRENENLDSIEESDDEADFENMDETKYVDLEKCVAIECAFHPKLKKWIPQRLVSKDRRIVHISALTMTSGHGYPPDDKIPKRPDLKFRSNR
jgi:hypothetical protein